MKCSMLKEPKLTAGKMPRRHAVSDKVRRLENEQQAEVPRLRRNVKAYNGLATPCNTSVFSESTRDDRGDTAGSHGSDNERAAL